MWNASVRNWKIDARSKRLTVFARSRTINNGKNQRDRYDFVEHRASESSAVDQEVPTGTYRQEIRVERTVVIAIEQIKWTSCCRDDDV